MITRENYELYFIDYSEGILSSDEVVMVENFLIINPDLQEELELINGNPIHFLPQESSVDFSFLKKPILISEENEDDFFIGAIENQLIPEQEQLLTDYLIQNPDKVVKQKRYFNTILQAESLTFPNKRTLKKSQRIGGYYWISGAVAASLGLLLYFTIPHEQQAGNLATLIQKNEFGYKPIKTNKILKDSSAQKEESKQNYQFNSNKYQNLVAIQAIDNASMRVKETPEIEKLKSIPEQDFRGELLANFMPQQTKGTMATTNRKVYSVKEFLIEKSQEIVAQRAGIQITSGTDILSFATNKVKLSTISKLVKIEYKNINNQRVKETTVAGVLRFKRKINE